MALRNFTNLAAFINPVIKPTKLSLRTPSEQDKAKSSTKAAKELAKFEVPRQIPQMQTAVAQGDAVTAAALAGDAAAELRKDVANVSKTVAGLSEGLHKFEDRILEMSISTVRESLSVIQSYVGDMLSKDNLISGDNAQVLARRLKDADTANEAITVLEEWYRLRNDYMERAKIAVPSFAASNILEYVQNSSNWSEIPNVRLTGIASLALSYMGGRSVAGFIASSLPAAIEYFGAFFSIKREVQFRDPVAALSVTRTTVNGTDSVTTTYTAVLDIKSHLVPRLWTPGKAKMKIHAIGVQPLTSLVGDDGTEIAFFGLTELEAPTAFASRECSSDLALHVVKTLPESSISGAYDATPRTVKAAARIVYTVENDPDGAFRTALIPMDVTYKVGAIPA